MPTPVPAVKSASGLAVINALLKTQRAPLRGPLVMGDTSSTFANYFWYAPSSTDAAYYADLNAQRASTVRFKYALSSAGMTVDNVAVSDTGTQWYSLVPTLFIGANQAISMDTTLKSFTSANASSPWHADLQIQSAPTDGNFKVCWFLSVPNATRSLCAEADRNGSVQNVFTVESVNGKVVLIQEN